MINDNRGVFFFKSKILFVLSKNFRALNILIYIMETKERDLK